MKLFDNFYNLSIKSNPNRKLVPIVLIGNLYEEDLKYGLFNPEFSTVDRNITKKYSDYNDNYIIALAPHSLLLQFEGYADQLLADYSIQVLPALLNDPQIKESADYKRKQIKVNNFNIELKNIPIKDLHLSDMIGEYEIEGMDVRILWVNPDLDKKIDIDLLHRGEDNEKSTLMFKGTINDIKQDTKKISLSIEDYSYKLFDKKIPTNRLSDDVNIPDEYKLKPIPMAYGTVNKAPTVVFHTGDYSSEFYVLADNTYGDDVDYGITCNPHKLYIGSETTYFRILQSSSVTYWLTPDDVLYTWPDSTQVSTQGLQNYFILEASYDAEGGAMNPLAYGILHCYIKRSPVKAFMEDGQYTLENGDTITWLGPSFSIDIGKPEKTFDVQEHSSIPLYGTYGGVPESLFANGTTGNVPELKIYGPNLGPDYDNVDDSYPNLYMKFMNDSSTGNPATSNPHQSEFHNSIRPANNEGQGTWGIMSGDCLTEFPRLVSNNAILYNFLMELHWQSVHRHEWTFPTIPEVLADPKNVGWLHFHKDTMQGFGMVNPGESPFGEGNTTDYFQLYMSFLYGQCENDYVFGQHGQMTPFFVNWIQQTGSAAAPTQRASDWNLGEVPEFIFKNHQYTTKAQDQFDYFRDNQVTGYGAIHNGHYSWFELLFDIMGKVDEDWIQADTDSGRVRGFAKLVHQLQMHAAGYVFGIQASYTGIAADGEVTSKTMMYSWLIPLEFDHDGNMFGTSNLKFWRTPEQLTAQEINEGFNEDSLGNTLWHWAASVSALIGDYEHLGSALTYTENSNFYDGAYWTDTYLQSQRQDLLVSPMSSYYNGNDFLQSDAYFGDVSPNHGDISNGWNPSQSSIYFVNPHSTNPFISFGPQYAQWFEAFDPLTWMGGQHLLSLAHNDNWSTGYLNMTAIGKLGGIHVYETGYLEQSVSESDNVAIKTIHNQALNRTEYTGLRVKHKFGSVSAKDVIACKTSYDGRVRAFYRTYIHSTTQSTVFVDVGTGGKKFTTLVEGIQTSSTGDFVEIQFYASEPDQSGEWVDPDVDEDIEGGYQDNANVNFWQNVNTDFGTGYLLENTDDGLVWDSPNKYSSLDLTYWAGLDAVVDIYSFIHNVSIVQDVLISDIIHKTYYADIQGRQDDTYDSWAGNNVNTLPDMVCHMLINELGIDYDSVNVDTLNLAKTYSSLHGAGTWDIGYSLQEEIDARTYISNLSSASNFAIKISSLGQVDFIALPDHVNTRPGFGPLPDNSNSVTIGLDKILKFKFKKTPKSQVVTRINIRYGYDYLNKKVLHETGYLKINQVLKNSYNWPYDFHKYSLAEISQSGVEHPQSTRTYTFKEVATLGVARRIRKFLLLQQCNTKLICEVELDIDYAYLEIGDVVNFEKLIDNIKPYFQDYTRFEEVNGQLMYPMFIISKINKSTSKIKLTLERLHRLDYGLPDLRQSIVNKTIEEYNEEHPVGGLVDIGQGFTRDGMYRGPHNPWLLDEYDLPGFNEHEGHDLDTFQWPDLGDCNGDGIINILDLVTMLNLILGTFDINDLTWDVPDGWINDNTILNVFDMNGDGIVNVQDVIQLINLILDQ